MARAAPVAINVLLQGALYDIRSEGRIVRCTIHVPPRTSPAAGAKAAQEIGDWLLGNVLRPRSGWLGLILDSRDGPSVVGPVTRSMLERLFQAAEHSRRPVAALVSNSPALFDQFSAISKQFAPQCSSVTSDPDVALGWMTSLPPASGRP